jgi:allantoinase
MAEVLAWNPVPRFGLLGKGDVAPGYDADLALLDPARYDGACVVGPARGCYVARRESPPGAAS